MYSVNIAFRDKDKILDKIHEIFLDLCFDDLFSKIIYENVYLQITEGHVIAVQEYITAETVPI